MAKENFNRIVTLEEFPNSLKEGVVIPVYKKQGKDPLQMNSYRGITLSSVLSKVLEIILYNDYPCSLMVVIFLTSCKPPIRRVSLVLMLFLLPKKL